jgi:DNA-directed RNA polymerase specialized sigma24 family protein
MASAALVDVARGVDRAIHKVDFRLYDSGMATLNQKPRSSSVDSARFRTTQWSIVLAAGRSSSAGAHDALAALCRTYWYPLYAYVRRQGHSPDDAQDLTQEFFARLLENNIAARADRARGKFRSFLLASLNHFLANEWRNAGARKRGRGRVVLSLDLAAGEGRYRLEPAHELTAEKLYQRRWALTLLEQTLAKLRDEFVESGKLDRILDVQQQSLARLNLKFDAPKRAAFAPVSVEDLATPNFFGWGKDGARLEPWRVGSWYHWRAQSRGSEYATSAPELPTAYRRFWKDSPHDQAEPGNDRGSGPPAERPSS